MEIKVYDIVAEYATTVSTAQKLYDIVYPELLAEKNISLDFTGVKIVTSLFFNLAITRILKDITRKKFDQLVEFTGLSERHQKLLTHLIKNAERYYYDEQYRNAVDTVMSEMASAL
ncbi:hypothetical protein DSM106972_078790 [Dulcicalothrix desertica PCC 7102]|uniref:DUF4325 domain-containing protein n=1 Tax=Dulcicalothrix desertica PCC 7102 TaxID=232991 RepID=A0A3S1ILL5_9CYAN|nr:STAS-like domain-containing protein [Dulcicalothrix desertica]RUS99177.1 hypothetical protein DSM106972_078790 [Dulcicalothrix desertica PCC 7102]TWH61030.1 uncharacterized protein DUF4325 [Dulcicalothrix desertica PCC 7102]